MYFLCILSLSLLTLVRSNPLNADKELICHFLKTVNGSNELRENVVKHYKNFLEQYVAETKKDIADIEEYLDREKLINETSSTQQNIDNIQRYLGNLFVDLISMRSQRTKKVINDFETNLNTEHSLFLRRVSFNGTNLKHMVLPIRAYTNQELLNLFGQYESKDKEPLPENIASRILALKTAELCSD